ncbi:alpha sarcin precursor [Thermoascus aurantiacus ATCC 26904]
MVSVKNLLFICLAAVSALAAPSPLEAQDTTWKCTNDGKTLVFSQSKAERNAHQAPLSDGKTGSGYPHWFKNGYDGNGKLTNGLKEPLIKFGKGACDRPPKHSKNGDAKDDHYLLEFPIYSDGHLYKYDKRPKERPPVARVIYTYPHKDFCGIVSHTHGNTGPLVPCRK